jgi:hypothetical protein
MTETKVSLCMEVLLMAESPFGEHTTCNPKESICIDAQRIYDSCGERHYTRYKTQIKLEEYWL